jgi:hypothetical protein
MDLYLTILARRRHPCRHSKSPAAFQPGIAASKQAQTRALDSAANGISDYLTMKQDTQNRQH